MDFCFSLFRVVLRNYQISLLITTMLNSIPNLLRSVILRAGTYHPAAGKQTPSSSAQPSADWTFPPSDKTAAMPKSALSTGNPPLGCVPDPSRGYPSTSSQSTTSHPNSVANHVKQREEHVCPLLHRQSHLAHHRMRRSHRHLQLASEHETHRRRHEKQRRELHAVQNHRFVLRQQREQQGKRQRQRQADSLHVASVAQPRGVLVHDARCEVLEDAPVRAAVNVVAERFGRLLAQRIVHFARCFLHVRFAEGGGLAAQRLDQLGMKRREERKPAGRTKARAETLGRKRPPNRESWPYGREHFGACAQG